jgi:hypothetical protein
LKLEESLRFTQLLFQLLRIVAMLLKLSKRHRSA